MHNLAAKRVGKGSNVITNIETAEKMIFSGWAFVSKVKETKIRTIIRVKKVGRDGVTITCTKQAYELFLNTKEA